MPTDRFDQHPGNNLDLLRLGFASLVLLSHAPELIDGNRSRELLSRLTGGAESFGEFAVGGFFALSGYLIMASWCRHPRLYAYFRNRILRIYPAFIVAFCISVLLVGPLTSPDRIAYFHSFGILRYAYSMFVLRDPWFAQSFPGLHYHEVNGAMWTISYEFVCYIAVAVVGFCANRHLRVVWSCIAAVLLVAACFLPELKSFPAIGHFSTPDAVRMFATFFVGGALYLLEFRKVVSNYAIVGLGAIFALTLFSSRFWIAGFAVFGGMFLIAIGLAWQKAAFARRWPDISYGTYLYGWPILQIVIWSRPGLGPWTVFVVSLLASLICGYLSWTLVEAPFMRLKNKTPRWVLGAGRAESNET